MTFRFLARELLGWLLLTVGLLGLYAGFALAWNRQLLDAGPIGFLAFLAFNAGVALLRSASAARLTIHVVAQSTNQPEQVLPALEPWQVRVVGGLLALASGVLTFNGWQRAALTGEFAPVHVFLPAFAVIGVGLGLFPRTYEDDRPLWQLPTEWQLIAGCVVVAVLANLLALQSVVNLVR